MADVEMKPEESKFTLSELDVYIYLMASHSLVLGVLKRGRGFNEGTLPCAAQSRVTDLNSTLISPFRFLYPLDLLCWNSFGLQTEEMQWNMTKWRQILLLAVTQRDVSTPIFYFASWRKGNRTSCGVPYRQCREPPREL